MENHTEKYFYYKCLLGQWYASLCNKQQQGAGYDNVLIAVFFRYAKSHTSVHLPETRF